MNLFQRFETAHNKEMLIDHADTVPGKQVSAFLSHNIFMIMIYCQTDDFVCLRENIINHSQMQDVCNLTAIVLFFLLS